MPFTHSAATCMCSKRRSGATNNDVLGLNRETQPAVHWCGLKRGSLGLPLVLSFTSGSESVELAPCLSHLWWQCARESREEPEQVAEARRQGRLPAAELSVTPGKAQQKLITGGIPAHKDPKLQPV